MYLYQFRHNGKSVNNHIVFVGSDGRYLQSYNTIVAFEPYDIGSGSGVRPGTVLSREYNRSSTTSKYVNSFLGITTPIREAAIKRGDIRVIPRLTMES